MIRSILRTALIIVSLLAFTLHSAADGPVIVIGGGGDVEQNIIKTFERIESEVQKAISVAQILNSINFEDEAVFEDFASQLSRIKSIEFNYDASADGMTFLEKDKLIINYNRVEAYFDFSEYDSESVKAFYIILSSVLSAEQSASLSENLSLIKKQSLVGGYEVFTIGLKDSDSVFYKSQGESFPLDSEITNELSCPVNQLKKWSVLSQAGRLSFEKLVLSFSLEVTCGDSLEYENVFFEVGERK